MAKVKTKKAAMDTTCTETTNGGWTWLVGSQQWYWRQGIGLNFGPISDSALAVSKWIPSLYVKTLNEAVMYSWGFENGKDYQAKVVQQPS